MKFVYKDQAQRSLLVIFLLFFCLIAIKAHDLTVVKGQIKDSKEILFISAYHSDTRYTSENIAEFIDTYRNLGGNCSVVIENMNCMGLDEAQRWPRRMKRLLDKHPHVAMIVLLGGEAWNSFLKLNDPEYNKVPVMFAMASRNGFLIPNDSISLTDYEPQSVDMYEQMHSVNVKMAIASNHNVIKNIELIRTLYPKNNHLAILTDNTYYGLAHYAYVKKELKKVSGIHPIYIDGRKKSLDQAVEALHGVPHNSVLLLAMWKIDSLNISYVNNAVAAFQFIQPHIPVFSLTGTGMGHWAIGGYMPHIEGIGRRLGFKAYEVLDKKELKAPEMITLRNEYRFDDQKIKEFKIKSSLLPENSILINHIPPFFVVYKKEIETLFLVFITLVLGLVTSLYYYFKMKALKNNMASLNEELRHDKAKLEKSEADLRHAKELAEEANLMKSAFVSNMSHEIRTPLNAIVGFTSLLVENDCATEEQKEYAKIIQTNSDLLLQLISDVLDISRLESGRLKFNYETRDLAATLSDMVVQTQRLSQEKQVAIATSFSDESLIIETDPLRLQQIVINLVNNALKFTPPGGKITIGFEKDIEDKCVLISVTDTGRGIPAEKHQDVFKRFEKLDEFILGTGLGLSICKLTINYMGGDIWIDRAYTDGARFVFSHPLTQADRKA